MKMIMMQGGNTTVMRFDTLKYVKMLIAAGFNQEQAESINGTQMMAIETLLSQVATRSEMHSEFQKPRAEMNAEFQNVHTEMKELEYRMKSMVYTCTISIIIAMFTVLGLGIATIPYVT